MNKNTKPAFRKYLPILISGVVGAVGGYLYYRYVGCVDGTCAITSNPYMSTLYGGMIGGLLGSVLTPGAGCCCSAGKCEDDSCE